MIKNCLILILSIAALFTALPTIATASTLVLEGGIDEEIKITEERTFSAADEGLGKLIFRFANPADYDSKTLFQRIDSHNVEYQPKPESINTETDAFGNVFTVVTWGALTRDAVVKETYGAVLHIDLKDRRSTAPFPLPVSDITDDARRFLKPTPLTQSGDESVRRLALKQSGAADGEQAAVMAILNWVIDNVKYKSPSEKYDAVWTLAARTGNCQNFSHLSIALLRSVGIPARIAGGVALGKPWKVPLEKGSLLQSIGQGGHAWIEVWYPDLGWVPYDAQQSHLFVGPRHIRQTVGADSRDINDTWKAAPVLPRLRDEITADYVKDDVRLVLKNTFDSPRSYVMTASVMLAAPAAAVPEPAPAGPGEAEFGNMDFPALIGYEVKIGADEGVRTFEKETSEYVTGDVTYAQAFTVLRPLRVDKVSLAMHRFGGRHGSLWIDIVSDEDGKPGHEGFRSFPLPLDGVPYFQGYKWFDFGLSTDVSDAPVLASGKYWIILRHSKDSIVNWFYIPGNVYGAPDDARSTEKGIDWSNVMNYDFNFKVKGVFLDKYP